jgi:hypothetical protein
MYIGGIGTIYVSVVRCELYALWILPKCCFELTQRASSGPTHKRAEGRTPVWGSEFTTKAATLKGGFSRAVPRFFVCGPWPSCYTRPRLIHKVLGRGVQSVVRSGARCASQVLDRGAQADARGATRVLDRGIQAVARAPLVVRCMYMAVVPGPMPTAVASRCCRRRSQKLACSCGS